jgi:hypothetical protein
MFKPHVPVAAAALSLAFSATALAEGSSDSSSESNSNRIQFVALVDAASLDAETVEALDIQVLDGPVLIVHVAAGLGLDDFYIRYDSDFGDLGPLEGFPELDLIDQEVIDKGIPAVLTDDVNPAAIAEAIDPSLPTASLRFVSDLAFWSADALAELPVDFSSADALASVDTSAAGLGIPMAGIPSMPDGRFIDPSYGAPDLVDLVLPAPTIDSAMGLLCTGLQTADAVCSVATSLSGAGGLWVDWMLGGPSIGGPSEDEDDSVEGEAEGDENEENEENEDDVDDETSESSDEEPPGSAPPSWEMTESDDSAPGLGQLESAAAAPAVKQSSKSLRSASRR